MKIKPISNNLETYNEARFNNNTKGMCISVKNGMKDENKTNYSSTALEAIMYEKGYLKHELIKQSFDEAKSFVEEYERDN